jgi:hypothetical protein
MGGDPLEGRVRDRLMARGDYANRSGRLTGSIASVEGKLGKPVKK